MKNFKLIVLLAGIILISGFSSCIFNFSGIKGDGNIKKETRAVSAFSEIEVSGMYQVYLTQGKTNSLVIEGDENLMQYIITKNDNNKLIIETKKSLNPTGDIKIYLTFTSLESIDLSGACEVIGEGRLKFDKIEFEGSGASEFTLDMKAGLVEFDLSGASEIHLKGKANKVLIDGSGAIKISAFDFVINDCEVDLSGASEASLNVTNTLSIDVSGAATIAYKGGAKIIKQSTSGASSIKVAE